MSSEENMAFDEGYDQGEKDMKSWVIQQIKELLESNRGKTSEFDYGYSRSLLELLEGLEKWI